MASEDEYNRPGSVKPAKVHKAACGIRFDEDELQEGVDFSGAASLLPSDNDPEGDSKPEPSVPDENR